ncbi:MAG: TonB-dependent receptor [Bacteroides sp.]|nr:TonB-dependent receptor [Bacteroides sp.]
MNLGIDFGLFGGRLSGNIELYNKKTTDLILGQRIPQTNGFSEVSAVNVGATRNRGLEIGLNSVNIQTRNFSWTTNLSFATNKNEITKIFGDNKDYPDQALFIGKPVLVHYDYEFGSIW